MTLDNNKTFSKTTSEIPTNRLTTEKLKRMADIISSMPQVEISQSTPEESTSTPLATKIRHNKVKTPKRVKKASTVKKKEPLPPPKEVKTPKKVSSSSNITGLLGVPYGMVGGKTATETLGETPEGAPEEPKIDVGFVQGATHNFFGTALTKTFNSGGIFGGAYTPSSAKRKDALEKLDYDLDKYEAVISGADTEDQFDYNLKLVLDKIEYDKAVDTASLGNQILSMVGDIAFNPFNYIPAVGQGGLFARVAAGAASGVITGQAENYINGENNNALVDLGYGMAFGSAIEAAALGVKALKGAGKPLGNASNHAQGFIIDIVNKANTGEQTAKEVTSATSEKVAEDFGNTVPKKKYWVQKFEKALHAPVATVQGAIDKLPEKGGEALKKIYQTLSGSERGYWGGVDQGKHFNAKNTINGKEEVGFTADEYKTMFIDEGREYVDNVADAFSNLLVVYKEEGLTKNKLDLMIRSRRADNKTRLDGDENFEVIIKNLDSLYETRGKRLRDAKVISGHPTKVAYDPFHISLIKLAEFRGKFKGTPAQVTKMLTEKFATLLTKSVEKTPYAKNLRAEYNAEVEAQIAKGLSDKEVLSFNDWLYQEAYKDALGYVDQGEAIAKGMLDADDAKGYFASYQHTRHAWDTSIVDSDGFSIDQLRSGVLETSTSYNHSTACDLGIANTFGITNRGDFSKYVKDTITDFSVESQIGARDAALHKKALRAELSVYYGRPGTDSEGSASWASAGIDFLKNITFVSHSAFMGYLNHFEVAEGIKAFGASFFIKGIPGLGSLLNDWTKGSMTKAQRRDFLNQLLGKDMTRDGTFAETFEQNLDHYARDRGNKAMAASNAALWNTKAKAMLVTGGQMITTLSPLTKYLNASQTSIVKEAQGLFVAELTRFAHSIKEGSKRTFFDEKTLERLDIPKDRFNKLVTDIKSCTSVEPSGKLSFDATLWDNKILRDTENLLTIRRLGKHVKDEVIQGTNLEDTFLWQGSKTSPWLGLLFQFKTFAVRSYNKRLAKSLMRIQDGDAAGQAMTWMLSGALGTVSFIGQTSLVASGMNDEQRSRYLKAVLGTDNLKEDPDGSLIATIAMNGAMRSGILAFPSLIANMLGYKAVLKSSGDEGAYEDKTEFSPIVGEGHFRSNIPAYNTLMSGLNMLLADIPNSIKDNFGSEYVPLEDRKRHLKHFGRDLKSFLPNLPYIQQSLINYITDQNER